jgi:hypothetical protein
MVKILSRKKIIYCALAYLIVPKLDLWKNSRIEKGVIVEQNLRALSRLEYEEKYYVETLKIPQDYIKGFQYYCIEDYEFVLH